MTSITSRIVFRLRGLPSAWLSRIGKTVEDYTKEFGLTHRSVNGGGAAAKQVAAAAAVGAAAVASGKKRAHNDGSERAGGAQRARVVQGAATVVAGAAAADAVHTEKEYINFKLMAMDNTEVRYRVKRTIRLRPVFEAYCKRQGISIKEVRFMFDGDSTCFRTDETPNSYEMEDGDTIYVVAQQTGD